MVVEVEVIGECVFCDVMAYVLLVAVIIYTIWVWWVSKKGEGGKSVKVVEVEDKAG